MKSVAPQPPLAPISLRSSPPPLPVVPRRRSSALRMGEKMGHTAHPKSIEMLFSTNGEKTTRKDLPHSNHMLITTREVCEAGRMDKKISPAKIPGLERASLSSTCQVIRVPNHGRWGWNDQKTPVALIWLVVGPPL